jgi:glutamyl-tRNA reductase
MRTLAGLNSGLPGDKDIVDQFQTAFEAAEQAGTAGPHAKALIKQAVALAKRVRRETSWGRFDPGYCHAALTRVQKQIPRDFANLRHVVVGSSMTSRSVLHSLYEQFNVKEPQATLIYRAHKGGQMKLLRKAIGHGRRLRVSSYDQPPVLSAILEADVVHFGIDHDEPVLTPEMLADRTAPESRPLYVVDFNTAGSTRGLDSLKYVQVWNARQLDAEVEQFAAELCAQDTFPEIVQEAEMWIEQQAPPAVPISVELPCEERDANGQPTCQRCGRIAIHAGSEA